MRISEVENRLLELRNLAIHLVVLDLRTVLFEVVDSALAVGGSDNGLGIEAEVGGDLAPCCLDGRDGVGQRAVLQEREDSTLECG